MAFDFVAYLRGKWGGDKGQPVPLRTIGVVPVFVSEIRTLVGGELLLFGWLYTGDFVTWYGDGVDRCTALYPVLNFSLRPPRTP